MKIINDKLLDEFRGPGRCEKCLFWFPVRYPHHIYARGFGGGSRMDVPENLVSLCSVMPGNGCHEACHARKPGFGVYDMLDLVRYRINDGRTVEQIEDYLDLLVRSPKGTVLT